MSSGNITRDLLDELGGGVVTGDYATGDSLPTEAKIAEKYEVSRTVVREAMKMLSAKGLVKAWPRRGTIVQKEENWNLMDPDVMKWILKRGMSVKLVRDFLNMRLAIEPAAAEMAAREGAETKQIEAALEMMHSAAAGGGDSLTADCTFHAAILEASGNRFFAQMSPLVDTALRMTIRVTNQIKGVTMANVEDHEEILDAISSRNSDLARQLIHAHISAALELVESAYPKSTGQ